MPVRFQARMLDFAKGLFAIQRRMADNKLKWLGFRREKKRTLSHPSQQGGAPFPMGAASMRMCRRSVDLFVDA
jgi:hypothetical protein